jgi:Aspartyl protease
MFLILSLHFLSWAMRYEYTAKYTDYGLEYMPRVVAFVKNPKTGTELTIFALVDSGASETLLQRKIGEELGIDIESSERVEFQGVGGVTLGYRHKVMLRLAGEKNGHEIECAFTALPGIPALLGERGFFENYKVTFEKYKNIFSVTAKKV